jgi:hypothetical protein
MIVSNRRRAASFHSASNQDQCIELVGRETNSILVSVADKKAAEPDAAIGAETGYPPQLPVPGSTSTAPGLPAIPCSASWATAGDSAKTEASGGAPGKLL